LTEGIVRRLPEARPLVPRSERELVKKMLQRKQGVVLKI
jgi:hypothetical protein